MGEQAIKPDAKLTIVATPIGNLGDMTIRSLEALRQADVIACEDTRRTGSLLAHFAIPHEPFIVCNAHTERSAAAEIERRLQAGKSVVLVSDAGTPGVSDPGYRVVAHVLAAGLEVEALPGPSAVLVALVSSGLDIERFSFEGFLPRKGAERKTRLRDLIAQQRTSVLFESPRRMAATITDLAETLGGQREVVIARELTKLHEEIWRGTLAEATDHLGSKEPRGEYVIVLDGATAVEVDDQQLEGAIAEILRNGGTRRDAVSEVVSKYGVAKRRVYRLALEVEPD